MGTIQAMSKPPSPDYDREAGLPLARRQRMITISLYQNTKYLSFLSGLRKKNPLIRNGPSVKHGLRTSEEIEIGKTKKLLDRSPSSPARSPVYIVLDEDKPPVFQAWLNEQGYTISSYRYG